MRLRLGIQGKLLGVIPVLWTLLAIDVSGKGQTAAHWLCDTIHGELIRQRYLVGSVFCTLTQKEA